MIRLGVAAFAVPLLLGAAPQPYQPATITVAQLFERNRHAAGAFVPGAYRMTTRTTSSDGDVWTSETQWNDRDYRTTVREGGFTWAYGDASGQRWHQDANGLVMPSTNYAQQVDPFINALRKPEDPTSGVKLLGLTGDSSPAFVVAVTPANGLVERRYYDARTYLLTRRELTDYDGHRQVWEYADYGSVFGRTVARSIAYEGDGAAVTSRTELVSYQRTAADDADLAIPRSKPLFDLGNRDAVTIPSRFTDNGIIVSATIAGRGLDFLLDSGSSDLLIDPDVARELGMASSGAVRVSFAGDYQIANARASELSVGGLSTQNVAFSTARFEEQLTDQRVVGLLGTDFIASGALEIDFKNKTVTLLRSTPGDLAARGWSPLPLRLDYGVPLLKATYSGIDGYFIADLGADYSTLYPHYFARFPNKIPARMPDEEEMVTLGGKPFGITHITMKSLVLGEWVFGDVQVVVPTASYAQERDYDGLIGRDTLSDFNLIFDYANRQLWFKPIVETK